MEPLEIARNNFEAFNRQDMDAIVATWEEGATFRNPFGEMKKDHVVELQKSFWKAFPDASVEIETIGLAQENVVAVEFVLRGTNLGPLPDGKAATGRTIALRGASFTTFKGGKIVSDHVYQDRLGIIEQLGLLTK
jgi:steroid delta-isomerase-like uncharacterized protein